MIVANNAKDQKTNTADMRKMTALDKISTRLLQSIDKSYADQRLMNEVDAEFQRVIDKQLDVSKGVAGNQIVDFLASLRDNQRRGTSSTKKNTLGIDTADLFTENIGDVFGYFQDVYKNKYQTLADLRFISKFIPSIGEGVRIYMDAIVGSDDVSQTITRNILLPSLSDADQKQVTAYVENMEKQLRLLPKIKVAYKKTLVSGSFFVYHVSYKELFSQYSHGLASGRIARDGSRLFGGNARQGTGTEVPSQQPAPPVGKMPKKGEHNPLGVAQESAIHLYDPSGEAGLEGFGAEALQLAKDGLVYKCSYDTAAMESCKSDIRALVEDAHLPYTRNGTQVTAKEFGDKLVSSIESDLPNIYFVDSDIPYDIISDAGTVVEAGMESSYNQIFNLRKDMDDEIEKINRMGNSADGTMDLNAPNGSKHYAQRFNGVSGTYLKWIDYKYMLPIDVLGQRVGYYHIITTPKTNKKGTNRRGATKTNEIGGILSSGSMSLFDQMDISEKRKETAIQNIVDTISDSILNQFSASFVKKNAAFRELIAECIIANGLVDNDYMIQFIPANQVIEFKCNEDEEGKGESILSEAMFPAHLLLSIVVCKLLNYINKGGNRTVAHISSGKVNRQLSNQVNRVIRDLQAGNVTFTDLLSSSMVFSKVTRDSNIAMPKDQQGNRLVEFEVQEGQQIELNTEYEAMLEKWCLLAMGIPPGITDNASNVEVAKKVVSDNIHVAGRVASLQSDLEEPTTELYKALIQDSDMDDGLKSQVINNLSFKLPRPRILANQNNSEALGTAYQNAQTIAGVMMGEDANEPDDMKIKSKFTEKVVRRETPFIQWDDMDQLLEDARAEVMAEKTKDNAKKAIDGGGETENPEDGLDQLGGF
jgi:hypothetical protein